MLLNLDELWKDLGEKRLPYNAPGWKKIDLSKEEKVEYIIARIKREEQKIR